MLCILTALAFLLQEDGVDKTSFSIIEGATYYQRKKESVVFGDFFLKLIGEITDGHWVGSFGARVLGKLTERYETLLILTCSAYVKVTAKIFTI